MKERVFAFLLTGALTLGLTACSGAPTQAQDSEPKDQITPLAVEAGKVGLLLLGDASNSYNQSHSRGMKAACEVLGLDYDTQVTVKAGIDGESACDNAIRELLEEGCQILFATSFDHEASMIAAAASHPDVQFCHAAGSQGACDHLDNTHNYFAKIHEAQYLSGIAAGLKTENNRLGYVATTSLAQEISGYTAFYLGAKSVNPKVTMLVRHTNEWSNPAKEEEATQSLIDLGCDVISYDSSTSIPAVTAEKNGVFLTGYHEDISSVAPNTALVSVQVDWGAYYTYALDCLLQGQPIDQDWCGSYANGVCALTALNEAIAAPDTKKTIATAAADLADGSVQVFSGPLHGVDAEGNVLDLGEGEFYVENKDTSAPSFSYLVDGITVLS